MKKVSKLQTSWEQRLGEKHCFVKMLLLQAFWQCSL